MNIVRGGEPSPTLSNYTKAMCLEAELCVLRAKIDCCKRWRRNGSADELTSTCDVHLEGKQKAYVGSGEDYTPPDKPNNLALGQVLLLLCD